MTIKDISLSSPIEEKIEWAMDCYRKMGGRMLEDLKIVDLLGKVKQAIPASHTEMSKTGIVALCRECEQDEGGSCCGAGMENKYDGLLLLINLFLNIKLPSARRDPESCFFLGEKGCLLKARHVICINYICRKISERIDPHEISALREKEGEEITLVFLLHEKIRQVLRGRMKNNQNG